MSNCESVFTIHGETEKLLSGVVFNCEGHHKIVHTNVNIQAILRVASVIEKQAIRPLFFWKKVQRGKDFFIMKLELLCR